jgi:signal transduction histidine kinase
MVSTGAVAARGSTSALLGRSLARLAELVNSSVAELRIESGTRTPERISVAAFIEEVEVGASIAANAKGLTLAVSPVEPGLVVQADRQLLAAAVANLLQNAFKFTRPGGHVSLTTVATPGRVLIEVADECGGLAPGDSRELFHQLERRKSSRTGLGLGLSISRKSVRADGGEITVRDIPGIGCVFTIDLPRT